MLEGKNAKFPSLVLMVVCRYGCAWMGFALNLSLLYMSISSSNNIGVMQVAFGFEFKPRIKVPIIPISD